MDRRSAHELTLRLSEALASVMTTATETVQTNPHAGGDAGYVSRVHLPDGTHRDVFGREQSGYSTMQRTGGFVAFDRIVGELRLLAGAEPTEPVDEPLIDTPSLVDRMTEVASLMRRAADELCVVRDELMIERSRVAG